MSLIGIQVTGEKLHPDQNACNYISIYDDLAFEMYVDKQIAEVIRMLETRKIIAVQGIKKEKNWLIYYNVTSFFYVLEERFEYARKLKGAMTELKSAGEKLGKLELSKTQAIQCEDYGKAKKKKTQMEEYRAQVWAENQIDELLEKNGVSEIK